MEQRSEREPLLSLERIDSWANQYAPDDRFPSGATCGDVRDAYISGADKVEAFYRLKITDGTLRVVEKVKQIQLEESVFYGCPKCRHSFSQSYNFCPGCGSQIID